MRLVRFDPNRELRNFEDVVNRFFSRTPSFLEEAPDDLSGAFWNPSVDFRENDSELLFTIELPGFEKSEIDISLNNGVLTISGERKFDEENRKEYRRVERWYGKFNRSFRLPETVDAEKVEANLKNGLLTVRLPRKEEARPRQIPVTIS